MLRWPSERETDQVVAEGQLGTARGRERATESVPVKAEVTRRKTIERNMLSGRDRRMSKGESRRGRSDASPSARPGTLSPGMMRSAQLRQCSVLLRDTRAVLSTAMGCLQLPDVWQLGQHPWTSEHDLVTETRELASAASRELKGRVRT